MAKTDNPDQMTGKEKLETIATPVSDVARKEVDSIVRAAVGAEMADMKKEFDAVLRETAAKLLEGKPEEATDGDPENPYLRQGDLKRSLEAMYPQGIGTHAAPVADDKPDSVFKTLAAASYCLVKSQGNAQQALDMAPRAGFRDHEVEAMSRALGVDDFSSGGALLQPEMSSEVVQEFVGDSAIVGDPAIQTIPVNGQVQIPYVTSGPDNVDWVAENAGGNASDIAYDQLTLNPNRQIVVVPVSKKMLNSVPIAMQHIERAMRMKLADDLDNKLIRGAGGSNEPTGLRYLADSSNLLNVNATVTAQNTEEDLGRLIQALQAQEIPWTGSSARFAVSPRIRRYLASIYIGSNPVFKQELLAGTLLGIPLAGESKFGIQKIPENLAVTDTSESEVYLYATDWLMMAVSEEITLELSTEAAYYNSSGAITASFPRDQAVLKLGMSMDFGSAARGKDIACLIDVDWGA